MLAVLARRRKKSRKSARQAGEARLQAKLERDELRDRYKAAFIQATGLIADPLHNEPVNSIIKRLNVKLNLSGLMCDRKNRDDIIAQNSIHLRLERHWTTNIPIPTPV